MKKKDDNEKAVTGNFLKEKLLIKSDRTIESLVIGGSLPTPVKETENSDLLFDKEAVLEKLGVKSLEEEFINTETVAKILDVDVSTVQSFARKGLIPSYRLKNVKGSHILYLPSEIEAAKQYTIEWNSSFANYFGIRESIKLIFSKLLDDEQSLLTQRETDILRLVLLEDKKPEEIAEKFTLTTSRIRHIFQNSIKRLSVKLNNLGEKLSLSYSLQEEVNALKSKLGEYEEEQNKMTVLPLKIKKTLSVNLKSFNLSARTINILDNADIETVADLARMKRTDFLKFRNAGKKSVDELEELLKDNGLTWNMKI